MNKFYGKLQILQALVWVPFLGVTLYTYINLPCFADMWGGLDFLPSHFYLFHKGD